MLRVWKLVFVLLALTITPLLFSVVQIQASQNSQIEIVKKGTFIIIPPPLFATKFIPFPKNLAAHPSQVAAAPRPTVTTPETISAPTLTPTPKIIEIVIQTTSTPTPTPAGSSQPVQTDDVQNFIIKQINDYRASQGLSSVTTSSETCDFAKTRAGEISQNFNHDGFTNRISNHSLPYPSYSKVTENIAMNSDYKEVVPGWILSPGHAENMRADTPYVCVAQNGNYFDYEGWKP